MKKIAPLILCSVLLAVPIFAQKKAAASKPNTVIFAVLNDGKTIEPIAKIAGGKLAQTVDGSDDGEILKAFSKTYYKPKTVYNLIFAGKAAGTVTVVKNDPTAECSQNLADVITKSSTAKLKGYVMGLATDIKPTKPSSGLRRTPTPAERAEIEKLVGAEFAKNKAGGKALKYINLTALDIDNDKSPEFVGTYWTAVSSTERGLLFFIAQKGARGKYGFGHSEFRLVKKDEVMSGEISSVDDGVYQETLLDVLDYDNNGVSEIFTYIQGFEGASFSVYQLGGGKWTQIFEASNYHCGY